MKPGRPEVREERTRRCAALASTEGEAVKRAQTRCGKPQLAFNGAAEQSAAVGSRFDRGWLPDQVRAGTLRHLAAEHFADHGQ